MLRSWDLKRRSSSLVRYLHGGTTALYPWQLSDNMPAVLFEAYALAEAADRAYLAEDNILSFPARAGRPSRARHYNRSGPKIPGNKGRKD